MNWEIGIRRDVEHRQADHDADHVDRGAHGPLGGEQAEAAGDGDAGDDREQDRLASDAPAVTIISSVSTMMPKRW